MLCSPSLVGPKFGFRRSASFNPDETLEATLLEKATSLSNLLTDGAPLAPAAAASFDLVSLCARHVAGDHDPEFLENYEWRFMEHYALLRSDDNAANPAADFAKPWQSWWRQQPHPCIFRRWKASSPRCA